VLLDVTGKAEGLEGYEIDPFAVAPERCVLQGALQKAARACDLSMVVDRPGLAEVRIRQRAEIDLTPSAAGGRSWKAQLRRAPCPFRAAAARCSARLVPVRARVTPPYPSSPGRLTCPQQHTRMLPTHSTGSGGSPGMMRLSRMQCALESLMRETLT
jgi:hypothetical protein